MAEFLALHQSIAAPIIEWGVFLLYLTIVLSPFIIIHHRIFRPTRWWHIVIAYNSSFLVFVLVEYFLDSINQWVIENLNSVELYYYGYSDGGFKAILALLAIYPLLIFYSAKMLFRFWTRKRFWITSLTFVLFVIGEILVVAYLTAYFIGQASYNF